MLDWTLTWTAYPPTPLRLPARPPSQPPHRRCRRTWNSTWVPWIWIWAPTPRLTLTDPPIAEIGLTEPMAKARLRGGYAVLRASFAENDLARAEGDGMGLVKLVIGKSGRVLGAGIVGAGAGELVALLALAIARQMDARALATLAAPYPSYADLVRQLGEQAAAAAPQPRFRHGFALGRLIG